MTVTSPSAWAAIAALCGALPHAHAHAQQAAPQVLSEAEVIRLVRASDPGVRRARLKAEAAAAGEVGVDAYPNPRLSWEREHLPDAGESEDAIALSVPIALSGERAARAALARADTASARAAALRERSAATRRGLELFYAALAAGARVELERAALARLEKGAAVLARRHEEGTASGYERARVDLELELSRSALREAEAAAAAQRARLAALLGLVAEPQLRGALAPAATRGSATAPESARLDALAGEQARSAGREAESAWLPTVELHAGVKLADGASTEAGYVAGLALDLPLFDHGQGLRARSGARAALADARAQEATRARELAIAHATGELHRAQRELGALKAGTGALLERLQRAARTGYVEGRRSVVELLDAQRAQTRVARRRLLLQHAARRAELALRDARGELE